MRRKYTFILMGFLLLSVGFVLLSPIVVDAQGLVPCSGLDCKITDLFKLAANIFNWLLGMAGIVAILIIVFAGLGMLTYGWFENPEVVLQGARYTLTRAITGFIIIAIAFIVVNTLLTVLGADNCLLSDPLLVLNPAGGCF